MVSDQTETIWTICEPTEGIFLYAAETCLYLKSAQSGSIQAFTFNAKPKTRLGRFLPTLMPQLLELALASVEGETLSISYDDFVAFEDQGITAFEDIVQWSPFLIEIKSSGIPGRCNFRYDIRYFWGNQPVHLERRGCFVKRGEQIFRLDKQMYALLEAIKKFNNLSDDAKESTESYIHFAEIKELSTDVGASIDSLMNKFRVVIPPSIGLDFIIDEEDRLTLIPKFDIQEIAPESILKTFIASDDPSDLCFQAEDGTWIKILFNEAQKDALRRMQKIRNVAGRERADVLRNPQKVFEGVAGEVDLSAFGQRVKGIGDFPFITQPFIQRSQTGIFDDPDIETSVEQPSATKLNIGIKYIYADGTEENVTFKSRDELLTFQNSVKTALQTGEGTIRISDKTLVVDRDLVQAIDAIVDKVLQKPIRKETRQNDRCYLLIYENEEDREYIENRELKPLCDVKLQLPHALKEGIELKKHQKDGIHWLQRNYLLKRSGCLLADDMGLGKTLQILTFLAWLIEKSEISPEGYDQERAPWNPALIIAPIMLLENEIWINDMKKFFKNDGAIFTPYIALHGDKLKSFRNAGSTGTETKLGTALLDLDRLRQYRVILTNYESVVNYQFSFAMMRSSWSVVVTDEAQEFKTPKTKISHALKSLSPKFRIAATGTPVETRLTDVWNIFDFLQPGSLLGSAREFNDEFAIPFENSKEDTKAILERLRNKLHIGKTTAYILRRDKTRELEGLPIKRDHKVFCDLSPEQRDLHIDFIQRARSGGEGNHPLSLIHKLMYLYQHPALIPRYEPFTADTIDTAFRQCPKLDKLVDILNNIRKHKEKALIFTRSLDMQQLLASAIHQKFGIYPDIVNGATPRKGNTITGSKTRKEMVRRFRESDGFNVIILSPDVAGVGLTLTEANHVIHYGRWWNPAKESQATDRAYRIGQCKDVNVYYLIARDPQSSFKTFDEKLDALIERRKQMAADFLAPMLPEDELGRELYKNLLEPDNVTPGTAQPISIDEVRALTWDRFEALVALLEEKQGNMAILTPRSNDYGIDVISRQDKTLKLIQCKHSRWDTSIEADVIAETISGFDNYRGTLLRDACKNYTMKPILITNGKCTSSAQIAARDNSVMIIGAQEIEKLLLKYPCSRAEIEITESKRLSSAMEVRNALSV